jgi:hypothetical protein
MGKPRLTRSNPDEPAATPLSVVVRYVFGFLGVIALLALAIGWLLNKF